MVCLFHFWLGARCKQDNQGKKPNQKTTVVVIRLVLFGCEVGCSLAQTGWVSPYQIGKSKKIPLGSEEKGDANSTCTATINNSFCSEFLSFADLGDGYFCLSVLNHDILHSQTGQVWEKLNYFSCWHVFGELIIHTHTKLNWTNHMTCTCEKHHLHFLCYCVQGTRINFMKIRSGGKGDTNSTFTISINHSLVQSFLSFADLVGGYLLLPASIYFQFLSSVV